MNENSNTHGILTDPAMKSAPYLPAIVIGRLSGPIVHQDGEWRGRRWSRWETYCIREHFAKSPRTSLLRQRATPGFTLSCRNSHRGFTLAVATPHKSSKELSESGKVRWAPFVGPRFFVWRLILGYFHFHASVYGLANTCHLDLLERVEATHSDFVNQLSTQGDAKEK